MTRDRTKKPHVSDVVEACKPTLPSPQPRLTRDDALIRIGEIKGELAILYPELVELREFLKPLEELYTSLSNEKYQLELSIHEVRVIPLRRVPKPSAEAIALQKQIDELTNEWSPEMIEKAKAEGLI